MKVNVRDLRNNDWAALGLKAGVEIHQQLDTERKLFCRCPAGLYSKHFDARVIRHMRPTLSELGEYDGTALMEFKTKKNITYLLDRRSVCTYEMDDTPPFEINAQAVDIALEVCLALGCKIVGEMHVIRKQYLDGSIPTGFQRTAILGVGGQIPYRGRTIGITQVSIEEDSCREVSDIGHDIVFRTDRLSMPLVEVVTDPDLRSPEEVADVVRIIGRLMRATGRVRRGAGASRQDVNVSVEGGTRVEIKGVPSIKLIDDLVAGEGVRQRALLNLRDDLIAGGFKAEDIEPRVTSVAHLFSKIPPKGFARSLRSGDAIKAVRFPGLRDAFAKELGPGLRFADELAGRVRVIACIESRPAITWQGNYEEQGIGEVTWRGVKKRLRAKSTDALVVLHGPEQDVDLAVREMTDRIREVLGGIPSETRQVMDAGITTFERILPGPDRMYPDTDSPPKGIPAAWVDRLSKRLSEPTWQIDARLIEAGLPSDVVETLGVSSRLALYDRAVAAGGPPKRLGTLLACVWKATERKGIALDKIPPETVAGLLIAASGGQIAFEGVPTLLEDAAGRPEETPEQLIRRRGFAPLPKDELAARIQKALETVPQPDKEEKDARVRYYMGHVMSELRGSVPGETARRLVSDMLGGRG